MTRELDYSLPSYGLSVDQLRTINTVKKWPSWRRRKWNRGMKGGSSGAFIYKYLEFKPLNQLSLKKAKDIIVDSRLYLAAPSDFNDPYDFLANITLPADAVERRKYFQHSARAALKKDSNILPDVHGFQNKLDKLVRNAMERSIIDPELFQKTIERARDRNGVACFSEDPRSLLMWSYYAGGHTGMCLQFNVINDDGVLPLCHKVHYRSELPHLVWPRDMDQIVDKAVLNKAEAWKHEKEVRYVSLHVVRDSLEFNFKALTGVILGCRFPDTSVDDLRKLLMEREKMGCPLPTIYKARRHNVLYKVHLSKLNDFYS